MAERVVRQELKGYIPIEAQMSLNWVAGHIAVRHHNRDVVYSIAVDPNNWWTPVTVRYGLAIWEEVAQEYEAA